MFKQLETVPLFKGLDTHTLDLLEPLFEPFSCAAETVIFEQGQRANYLYLILAGSVEVLYKPYDGPALTVTSLKAGSVVGWSAAIGNTVYTSGAICREDCQAIRMRGEDLHRLCTKEPESGQIIMNRLADSVSSRWDDAQNQIQVLLEKNISEIKSANRRRRRIRKER